MAVDEIAATVVTAEIGIERALLILRDDLDLVGQTFVSVSTTRMPVPPRSLSDRIHPSTVDLQSPFGK